MKTKFKKILIVLLLFFIFFSGLIVGRELSKHDEFFKYDYVTYKLENSFSSLSLDLTKNKYYLSENGKPSITGDLIILKDYAYKVKKDDLDYGYIIIQKDYALFIHDNCVIVCNPINNQLTINGDVNY